jgi:MoaA/NifB/PqqE/SkfB family radical SAM enzyme
MDLGLFREVTDKILSIRKPGESFNVAYLSGGEPLLHDSLMEMAEIACERFDRVTVLTNGTLLKPYLKGFARHSPKLCVQVSVDGDEARNDAIRGEGVYGKAARALGALAEEGIPHWLSYTVSRANKDCASSVLELAKRTGSSFNNVTPYTGDPDLMLSYPEWKEFKYGYELAARRLGMETSHGPHCCGFTYACGARHGGLTVNPDGTVAGCARIDDVCGYYDRMEDCISAVPRSIHETCMKAAWGSIPRFPFLSRLE